MTFTETAPQPTFQTPLGGFDSWFDAADACERADLDPQTCIQWGKKTPDAVCWEHQDGAPSIRLSFSIKVF